MNKSAKMRVVALISGGKDSCYNMMQCVQHGHDIVALANLKPHQQDELDSYMYQTVGHQAIDLYAEAMDLPLYRRTIQGSSLELGKDYIRNEKDEVEDLYQLLLSIKSEIEFDAVSSGAILSDYQRVRVEHVCSRLGITSLAYLWRRQQKELYEEMIANGLVAIIVKVAVMGLIPRKHLGLKMAELHPVLLKLNSQFGINVCGEGGEFETFTLDCPLFKKRIVIDDSEVIIHSDDAFAEVGYLRFKAMHAEDKSNDIDPNKSLTTIVRELPIQYCGDSIENIPNDASYVNEESCTIDRISIIVENENEREDFTENIFVKSTTRFLWITGLKGSMKEGISTEQATKKVMDQLKDKVLSLGASMDDIILMQLFVKNMSDFSRINSIYQKYFHINPPARACVEANLDDDAFLQMDCLLYHSIHLPFKEDHGNEEVSRSHELQHRKESMYVQSISHWASANIGPYSQAIKIGPLKLISGCIGLWPATMSIVEGGIAVQAALSLRHIDRIITAFSPQESILNVFYGFGYVTQYQKIAIAEEAFKKTVQSKRNPFSCDNSAVVSYVVVPRLPAGALVEYQMMTYSEPAQWNDFSECVDYEKASLTFQGVCYQDTRTCGVVNCHIKPIITTLDLQELLTFYSQHLLKISSQHKLSLTDLLTMRVFYVTSAFSCTTTNDISACVSSLLQTKMNAGPAFTLLPVEGLKGHAVMLISCWFHSG